MRVFAPFLVCVTHSKLSKNMQASAVARAVMIVETGEIFDSISDAARVFMINSASIHCALRKQTRCCDLPKPP